MEDWQYRRQLPLAPGSETMILKAAQVEMLANDDIKAAYKRYWDACEFLRSAFHVNAEADGDDFRGLEAAANDLLNALRGWMRANHSRAGLIGRFRRPFLS